MLLECALAAVLTVVPEEGAALEGGYQEGLKQGLWLHFEEASSRVRRAELYEAGWLREELDLEAVRADREVVEPKCAVEQRPEPRRLRAEFRRVLERWAPVAVPGGLWEMMIRRGGGEAHELLRLVHRLAHRRFSGLREGEEDVGRPEATARFVALRDQLDRWLLSADGPRSLRSAALERFDFPADRLEAELSRELPGPGASAEERLVVAQWCRIPRPRPTPQLEATLRAWYSTREPLWHSVDDPSLCAARALARWGGEDNLGFLLEQLFHGSSPENAAAGLHEVLGPGQAALVRRAYLALGKPDITNPALGSAEFWRVPILEQTHAWDVVAEDLRSREEARVLRALRFVARTRAPEVEQAFAELLASPGDEPWRSTAKEVKAWRDQQRRLGAKLAGVRDRPEPFPPIER